MEKQSAFAGPVEFDMSFAAGSPLVGFPAAFEEAVVRADAACSVETFVCSGAALGEALAEMSPAGAVYENEEFAEFAQEGEIIRFYFRRPGEKIPYLKTVLREGRIEIHTVCEEDWPWGKRREIWAYLMLEKLLIKENAFILHSASVLYRGSAILFSAPSGTGKSTQACLWETYAGAAAFNGDRNILYRQEDGWYVLGIPWSGTSQDHRNLAVPLGGIAVVRRGETDSTQELSAAEKFVQIYGEVTKNNWDADFAESLIRLIRHLAQEALIVQLKCTMNQSAVLCLKDRLERGLPDGTL